MPMGEQPLPEHAGSKSRYVKDEVHGVIWGNHPDATAEQLEKLKAAVIACKGAFAYSLEDMPGYKGEPVSIKLDTDQPVFSKARRYSKLEEEIRDQKCNEQLSANIIGPCNTTKYASCPTMPGKKDADGNWTLWC